MASQVVTVPVICMKVKTSISAPPVRRFHVLSNTHMTHGINRGRSMAPVSCLACPRRSLADELISGDDEFYENSENMEDGPV
jgi:hypothetical protein